MESTGDLPRAFFDGLYTFRIPVAVGSMVAAIVAIVVAWRVGWFAEARRHPARATVLFVIVLAVALPMTYYLASPIWIRTELIEPESAFDVPLVVASTSPLFAMPTPMLATPTLFAPRTVAAGEFSGTDEFHFGRGTAGIVETAPGSYTLRLVDFSVRNGPDLFVYLSRDADGYADGYADGALELGRLKATDGSFSYALAAGTEPTEFASAIIWCKQFSHLFAVARLAAT